MQQKRKLPIPENQIDPIYNNWNEVKKKIARNTKVPYVKEGQVFWCSVGQNIGTEIYGKGKDFVRPVLIFKKFSKYTFSVIPLSTKARHNHPWYAPFKFAGKNQVAVLPQAQPIDVARLREYMGQLPDKDFDRIKHLLKTLFFK